MELAGKFACVNELNDEQKSSLEEAAKSGVLLFQQAPPGTGKTKSAAAMMAALADVDEGISILASATSNLPVAKMAEEMEKTGVDPGMLAFFSGVAKVKYGPQIAQVGHLLVTEVKKDATKKKCEVAEVKELEKYESVVQKRPRRAEERKVGEIVLSHDFKKVVFGTLHMALAIRSAHLNRTCIVVDETTQASFTTIAHLCCRMYRLERAVVTGDRRQLGVHLAQYDDVLQVGFGLESVVEQLDVSPDVTRTALVRCYRAHPILVQAFSFAAYEQHGELVVPAVRAEDRSGFVGLGLNLPNPGVPVVLLQVGGELIQDPTSFSLVFTLPKLTSKIHFYSHFKSKRSQTFYLA